MITFKELAKKVKGNIIESSTEKWGKRMNRYSAEKDIKMALKHIKRCSTSFIIRKISK